MKNAFVCFKHVVSVDWVRMGLTLKTNNNNNNNNNTNNFKKKDTKGFGDDDVPMHPGSFQPTKTE